MASKRTKAAAAAAKRIPVVGTGVVVLPAISAAADAGLNLSTIADMGAWKRFLENLTFNFTGVHPISGAVEGQRLVRTYGPIATYLIARRFAGRHISRVFRPFKLRF